LKTKEAWIRVKKASELRAGMAVRWTPSIDFGRNVTWTLLKPSNDGRRCLACNSRCTSWDVGDDMEWCVRLPVREGRLYRLSDESLSETDSTERAPRERELTNAKG
jgi:hypothetical protein